MRHKSAAVERQLRSVALRSVHPLGAGRARGALVRALRVVGGDDAGDAGNPRSPTWREPRMARLEAVLLMAGEPLSTRKLAQFAGLADGTEARTLIRALNDHYNATGTAFHIEEVAGGHQLLTRPRFAPWLRRLVQSPVQLRLSAPALETLAVVAYRQPVLRADIEAIRGVQSGEMLRQLMERDLVRIAGRSPELGRPFYYGTTRRFLQMFGLRRLEELPQVERARVEIGQSAPDATSTRPDEPGGSDTVSIHQSAEEFQVKMQVVPELASEEKLETLVATLWDGDVPAALAAKAADDDDDDYEEDDEDEDDDDEDEEFDDDLEEDEWEEVDDDLDEDEFDEEDEWDEEDDWDDEDEDEDDDEDDDEDWDDEE
jgi:segregation and condensation protein B